MGIGSVLPENWCAPEGGIFHRRCPKVGSGAEVILCSLRGGWLGGETQRSILRWAEKPAIELIVLGHSGGKFPLFFESQCGGGRLFYVRCAEVGLGKARRCFVFIVVPLNSVRAGWVVQMVDLRAIMSVELFAGRRQSVG